jgi:hypothetical protein
MSQIHKSFTLLFCILYLSHSIKVPSAYIQLVNHLSSTVGHNTTQINTGIASINNPLPKLSDFNEDVARTIFFIERRADFHEDYLNHAPKGSFDATEDASRRAKHTGMKADQFEDLSWKKNSKGSYDYKEDEYQTKHWAIWKK